MSLFPILSRSNPHHSADQLNNNAMRGTALTVGVVGLAFVLLAMVMVIWGSSDLSSPSVGVLMRVAGILLAVSLVLPKARKPSLITVVVAGVGLVLVLTRPGLIWVALFGWVVWVAFNRQSTDDKD
jgi:hypothetical protein